MPTPPAGCNPTGYSFDGDDDEGTFKALFTSALGDAAGCLNTTIE